MKTALIFAIIVSIMGGAAFVVTKMVVKPAMSASAAAEDVAEKTTDESEGAPEGQSEVYLVENILVNPKGTGGTRYLSTSLGLEVGSAEAVAELTARNLQVRDMLNSILAARTVAQLTDPVERENMRQEILKRLNKMISGEQLTAVYFVDYVMQ